MDKDPYLVMPYEVEPQLLDWENRFPSKVKLLRLDTWCGIPNYAITVTDSNTSDRKKVRVFFSQPHAHEPATTAAMMDYLSRLLTGRAADGWSGQAGRRSASSLLKRAIVSFVPIGNPDGRRRAPMRFWDGTRFTNEEFHVWMRGRDMKTGKLWKRLGKWSSRKERPATLGIVYEQISQHEYVEPNRHYASSFFRLFFAIDKKYRVDYWLDMHQTEFQNRPVNCFIVLPIIQNKLPREIADENAAWGEEITEAWRASGASPMPPTPLGYTGVQASYFKKLWGPIKMKFPGVSTEVQNNNLRTPVSKQVELGEIAIRITVERAIRMGRQRSRRR